MQIEVRIDPTCTEPKVLILTDAITDEVKELLGKFKQESRKVITGFRADTAVILETEQIIRFYAANQKVYAVTAAGEYVVHWRLYELEESLDSQFQQLLLSGRWRSGVF